MKSIQEKLINADKLIAEFKTMRQLQKNYFKTRDYAVLKQSKSQEQKVDQMIDQFQGTKPMQGQFW